MMTREEIRALIAKQEQDASWQCAGCDRTFSALANCRRIKGRFFCIECYRNAFPQGL